MPSLLEGEFRYLFPEQWQVRKWDDTEFHQQRFQFFGGSMRQISSIIAVSNRCFS